MNFFRVLPLLILLLLSGGTALAQSSGALLRTPYAPPAQKGTVRSYLEDIAKRTGLTISYSDELVRRRRTVRLKGDEQTVEAVLNVILEGTGLVASERSGKILLIPASGEAPAPSSGQTATISGYVKDSASREVLIGAYVYIPSINVGTATNAYGFYSITVPPGNYQIVTASGGYRADTSGIRLGADLRRDVLLPYGLALTGVTVSSKKEAPQDHAQLSMNDIARHAGLLGENDVLRAIQQLSGVQSGTDGFTTVMVRGGDPGQNLNLLDGVPLYFIDHFTGLTSIFNTDAVKSVDFYKGAFPSRYGGRISSIIDVSSRDGNMDHISGSASLGLVKGNLTLEGPIIKDKASIMISARRTWVDAIWRAWYDQLRVNFYDINGKVNYIINKNNRVYASFYTGRDQFKLETEDNNRQRLFWGNSVGAARWTSIINPKLFINTTATYSHFRYLMSGADNGALPDSAGKKPGFTGNSTINEAALRVQADYFLSASHHMQAGIHYASSDFSPASTTFEELSGEQFTVNASRFRANEITAYAEDEWKFADRWMLRGGLHFANWFSDRYYYSSLQPRLFLSWRPGGSQHVFASVSNMSQFLHQLTNSSGGFPSDFWVPSTSRLAPEHAWQYALGYTRKLGSRIEATTEVYYKDLRNLITYRSSNTIFEQSGQWEQALTQGRGWSYGAELSARGRFGPLTTSLAYTLSETWRQFADLNNGDPFPFRYDRRHNLKLEAIVQHRKRFNAIIGWTYMSGEAITLPDQMYPDFDNNLLGNPNPGPGDLYPTATYNYPARNNYRLPPIHRLDIAFNFIKQRGPRFERTWTLGVFNAYARKNVMYVELRQTPNSHGYSLAGYSFLRFIPTVSYSVKF